ncbi:hypothetical protein V2S66_25260 [Streptomyces sp. V4-01]|uniref:Uncharacterized protein n=1 Tax=Actinacidiphila polyblastidii TaxID=3110430 RepID=A0ABU7PHI2_9ACTN|nr:hypothetical protein [Streptomyces sp. V4-01]
MTNRIELADLFRRAATIIQTNGHHQGDYIPDPFNRVLNALPHERPMNIVAALRCAETGHPQRYGPASTGAVRFLAGRLLVDGEPPFWPDDYSMESHVAAWGDVAGRTVAEVVAVLLDAAEAAPVPRAAVVGRTLTMSDGTEWVLWSVPADGEPLYTVAGVRGGPGVQQSSYADLSARFGPVSVGSAW